MNKLRVISGLIAVLALLGGCDTRPPPIIRGEYPVPEDAMVTEPPPGEYGGLFIVSETTQPTTFNYYVPNDLTTAVVLGRMFAGLTDFDPMKGEMVPALAKSWEIGEDQKSYTFHLREGIKWSDGAPFSADDVVFTFNLIVAEREDPETGEMVPIYPTRQYEDFKYENGTLSCEKIDDYTVIFRTPDIYAPFMFDIMGLPIMPKHKLAASNDDETFMKMWSTQTGIENPSEIVGTGPFVLESYRPGERLILKPNPHYWKVDSKGQRLPYVDRLIMKFVGDSNTSIISFATGQTSIAGVGPSDVSWVQRNEKEFDFTLYERGPSTSVSMIWFNLNPGKNEEGIPYVEPYKMAWFQNKLFRQAMFYAFDREAVIDAVFFGRGKPLDSMVAEAQGDWFNPNVRKYRYNPAKARELLAEAGFTWNPAGKLIGPQGNTVEFNLLIPAGGSSWESMVVTYKENLSDIGVTMNITPVDFATLIRRIDYTMDYEAGVIGWGSSSAAYDPSGSKALYMSSGIYHLWHPKQETPATPWEAKIDKLFTEQEGTLDLKRRQELMHEVQAILAEESPLILLASVQGYVGVQNHWRNFTIPPAGSTTWNIEEIWTDRPLDDPDN
nr:ABC transporter substrate-binding protein [Cerasicoccus arenae]